MNTYYSDRSSRPAGLFSFGLLGGLQVRLRRPHWREAQGKGRASLPAGEIERLRSQPLRDGIHE